MFPKGSTERIYRIYRMHVLYYPWILIDSGSPKESLKNKYENIHPNRNSPSRNYPPGNKHVPLLEKENHWLKSGSVRDMWSFPGGWCLFLLVEDLFFFATAVQLGDAKPSRLVWLWSSASWSKAMKLPSRPKLGTYKAVHLMIGPSRSNHSKHGAYCPCQKKYRERERDNWQ